MFSNVFSMFSNGFAWCCPNDLNFLVWFCCYPNQVPVYPKCRRQWVTCVGRWGLLLDVKKHRMVGIRVCLLGANGPCSVVNSLFSFRKGHPFDARFCASILHLTGVTLQQTVGLKSLRKNALRFLQNSPFGVMMLWRFFSLLTMAVAVRPMMDGSSNGKVSVGKKFCRLKPGTGADCVEQVGGGGGMDRGKTTVSQQEPLPCIQNHDHFIWGWLIVEIGSKRGNIQNLKGLVLAFGDVARTHCQICSSNDSVPSRWERIKTNMAMPF